MPIHSAVTLAALPARSTYRPVTDIARADRPKRAFYFYAEGAFYDDFNFDNCREFSQFDYKATVKNIDFTIQDMYYKRLFLLRRQRNGCRHYLCPWLIVPYVKLSATSFSARIRDPSLGPQTLSLTVKPYSIFDRSINSKTRRQIQEDSAVPATARTLELVSSDTGVQAVWDNPKSPATPTIIDELDCIADQKITVTISDATAAYAYSSTIDIRASTSETVGRIYLVFLPYQNRKALLFDATLPVGPNAAANTVELKLLTTAASQPTVDKLNTVFKRAGIVYQDAGATVKLKDGTTLAPGGTIPISIGQAINISDDDQAITVTDTFREQIATIGGVPWSTIAGKSWWTDDPTYLFVFQMNYVNKHGIRGGSRIGSASAHVFTTLRRTLAHEAGHALGLDHWFYSKKNNDDAGHAVQAAEGAAKKIGIGSTKSLYMFHDSANASGLAAAFAAQWSGAAAASHSERVETVGALLRQRAYARYKTDDFMDYQYQNAGNDMPVHQEQLRKMQVEQLRYSI